MKRVKIQKSAALSHHEHEEADGTQDCKIPAPIIYTFDGLYALFTSSAIGCFLIVLFLSSTYSHTTRVVVFALS